jgi:large subunit ribosomal protein L4
MKIEIIDTKKQKAGEKSLHKGFADSGINTEVLLQYVRSFMLNNRQGTSSTKTRGEVAGSGIKPWRQKGTGRARVGDKRTPIWRHGGIVHGPQPKSWNIELNKKVKKLALISAINHKFADQKVLVLDSFDAFGKKTKESLAIIRKLKLERNILVVSDKVSADMQLGLRNISNVTTSNVETLNAFQVFSADAVLFSQSSLETLEKKLFTPSK